MKYDFTKVITKDIEGKKTKKQDASENLANAIYHFASGKNLNLVEIAREIFKGKPVELDKVEIIEIEMIVKDKRSGFFAFAQKAILDYIESVKKESNPK